MAVDSRNTYATGVKAFCLFAELYDVPTNVFALDQALVYQVIEYFACHLRHSRRIKSVTISGYITHVADLLKSMGLNPATHLRSRRTDFILDSYLREDNALAPQRLRIKIPLSADILWRLFDFLDRTLPPIEPPTLSLFKAGFSLGFGLGLRPSEYLFDRLPPATLVPSAHDADEDDVVDDGEEARSDHMIPGRNAYFQWPGSTVFLPVTDPTAYPAGYPVSLLVFLDHTKNDPFGKGLPRCIADAPSGSLFNCLRSVFDYLRCYPPQPDSPILSGGPSVLTRGMVNKTLKQVARYLGLDPSRLLPHSIRVGNASQTGSLPVQDQLLLTGHFSLNGKMAYCRKSLELAQRAAPAIHDTAVQSLPDIILQYMPRPTGV